MPLFGTSTATLQKRVIETLKEKHEIDRKTLDALARSAQGGMFVRSVPSRARRARLEAVLQPGGYLDRLEAAGLKRDDIHFTPEAYRRAREIGANNHIDVFEHLPRVGRRHALEQGKPLGRYADWSVSTPGATLDFSVQVKDQVFPAFVLGPPRWEDPSKKDLIEGRAELLNAVSTVTELEDFIDTILVAEADYFAAKNVKVTSVNERYGIQGMRRKAFFSALHDAINSADATSLPEELKPTARGRLIEAQESLFVGRDFRMDVGDHDNYWPYWHNYASFLVTAIEQTAKDTPEHTMLKNRLEDIYNRKTVFTWNRSIDERDFEVSVGGALVHRVPYGAGPGHRASLKEGSTTFQPKYEVLTAKSEGLPAELTEYAGYQVVRDTDPAGTLRFDYMGEGSLERVGKEVPAELKEHIEARDVPNVELGLRPLVDGEQARANVSADWDKGGTINVARIFIGWWGHCHNEAPLNAMGVNPRKSVSLYRADRRIPAGKALQTYDHNDVWNVAGALTADHEDGYGIERLGTLRETHVDRARLAGERNNGGNWMLFNLGTDSSGTEPRRVIVETQVTELWHRNGEPYDRPMARFRRDIENDDGTFSPNPDWTRQRFRDRDLIEVNAFDRRMTVSSKFITFGSDGQPTERTLQAHLDPSKDEFVKLAEEIGYRAPDGGGHVSEMHFNPKTKAFREIGFEVKKGPTGYVREEIDRAESHASAITSVQETTYDSVIALHKFVCDDIGLPFAFDTDPGKAVWNYPVRSVRLDRERTVRKEERGETFSYATYKLTYATEGGPSGEARYIIKRDVEGRAVRALALDPMPDFAFRQQRWVCAPVAAADNGEPAYNMRGIEAGYATKTDLHGALPKLSDIDASLWEREAALLYGALSSNTAPKNAYLFEDEDGTLTSFNDEGAFRKAIHEDTRVRKQEAVDHVLL